jgi:hypothetical protein
LFFSVFLSFTGEMIVLQVFTSCVVSYNFQFFFICLVDAPSDRSSNPTCHNTLGVAIPVYADTDSYF